MAQAFPIVELLLVVLGMALLVLELKAPGSFVFAALATALFLLFFWLQALAGAPLVGLALVLFLLGLSLVCVELVCTPGSAVAGVTGLMCVLAGLVVAGLDEVPVGSDGWANVAIETIKCGLTMAGGAVLACVFARYLPYIPVANRLILSPPDERNDAEGDSEDARGALLGQVGFAISLLGFAGNASIGGRRVDVVAEGECIPAGAAIRVVEVEGMRVVVRPL